jgi:hypothetical protein
MTREERIKQVGFGGYSDDILDKMYDMHIDEELELPHSMTNHWCERIQEGFVLYWGDKNGAHSRCFVRSSIEPKPFKTIQPTLF